MTLSSTLVRMTGVRAGVIVAGMAAAICVAAPADAQLGSRLPGGSASTRTTDDTGSVAGRQAHLLKRSDDLLRNIAACLLKREPSRTATLLATTPGSRREQRILSRMQFEECFGSSEYNAVGFGSLLFRGALAETLLMRTPDARPGRMSAETLTSWQKSAFEKKDSDHSYALLLSAAVCTAIAAPDKAMAVLAAKPMSKEEKAALQAIAPDLGGCVDEGVKAEFSAQSMRALIAEAAYHDRISPLSAAEAQQD